MDEATSLLEEKLKESIRTDPLVMVRCATATCILKLLRNKLFLSLEHQKPRMELITTSHYDKC